MKADSCPVCGKVMRHSFSSFSNMHIYLCNEDRPYLHDTKITTREVLAAKETPGKKTYEKKEILEPSMV